MEQSVGLASFDQTAPFVPHDRRYVRECSVACRTTVDPNGDKISRVQSRNFCDVTAKFFRTSVVNGENGQIKFLFSVDHSHCLQN